MWLVADCAAILLYSSVYRFCDSPTLGYFRCSVQFQPNRLTSRQPRSTAKLSSAYIFNELSVWRNTKEEIASEKNLPFRAPCKFFRSSFLPENGSRWGSLKRNSIDFLLLLCTIRCQFIEFDWILIFICWKLHQRKITAKSTNFENVLDLEKDGCCKFFQLN